MKPIAQIAEELATGATTSRALTEEALVRIEDPDGEGSRTFVRVFRHCRPRSPRKARVFFPLVQLAGTCLWTRNRRNCNEYNGFPEFPVSLLASPAELLKASLARQARPSRI